MSFVIPVFNEAESIAGVVEDLLADVLSRLDETEILIVDDASTDSTPAVLRELAEGDPRVRIERMGRNSGQGPATRHGFEASTGEWLCHIDGDGQLVPSDFWALWEARTEAGLVLGVRTDRQDSRVRRLVTRTVRAGLRPLTGRHFADAAAPFRLLTREAWEDVAPFVGSRARSFSVMVTVAVAARGWTVREVPVSHRERLHGESALEGTALLAFLARGVAELAGLRVRLARRS